MKKARLYLSSLERKYLDKYKELPETTMQKLREMGATSDTVHNVIQKRMDVIWKETREKTKTDKDGFTTLLPTDCPFLT